MLITIIAGSITIREFALAVPAVPLFASVRFGVVLVEPLTTVAATNLTDANRGTAGTARANSRIVIDPAIIVINTQPSSTVALENSDVTFTVNATISGVTGQAISYQWQRLDVGNTTWTTITGATNSSYTKTSVKTASDNGVKYRCVLTNVYTGTVLTNEVYIVVSAQRKFIITQPGYYEITPSSGASYFNFKMWAAGGSGEGEGSVQRGGSGGFAKGKVLIPSNNTNKVYLFVGSTGTGSQDNPYFGYGSGAGAGGQYSRIVFDTNEVIVGGGGGAGQGGHGGYGGGANLGGGTGTGSYAGGGASTSAGGTGGSSNDRTGGTGLFYTNGYYLNSGGMGGGSGTCCGKRGGGGGAGYYGGGGGGGGYSNNDGSGGGGGAGYATNGIIDLVTQSGSQGTSNGATVPYSTDPDYISGYAGSSQNGLVVIEFSSPVGQQAYTSPGTYSWTCPTGVTSVSVVCVGGGGRGTSQTEYFSAQFNGSNVPGGGGGLGWKNNIPVSPGQTYTVKVGEQSFDNLGVEGLGTYTGNGSGDSYFINASTVLGGGGGFYSYKGGGFVGDGGGKGGGSHNASVGAGGGFWGGGGAGGYTGSGGSGGFSSYQPGSGQGGGGGGGGGASFPAGGGGGVGIYGQGSNGYAGSSTNGGGGGSGGSAGTSGGEGYKGNGGSYGGGGGCGSSSESGGIAGAGAVRIIWGPNRSFPSTNTNDMTPT